VVLVDSSIWIDYFNGHENSGTAKLDELLSTTIVGVGDLILTEVLQGFKSDTDHKMAKTLLLDLQLHELGGMDMAVKAADHFRTLRRRGITVRKTVDCIIAAYCIEHGVPLLHNDRDFDPFARYLGLRPVLSLER
jgi:predicted nucleic acid-binding protein